MIVQQSELWQSNFIGYTNTTCTSTRPPRLRGKGLLVTVFSILIIMSINDIVLNLDMPADEDLGYDLLNTQSLAEAPRRQNLTAPDIESSSGIPDSLDGIGTAEFLSMRQAIYPLNIELNPEASARCRRSIIASHENSAPKSALHTAPSFETELHKNVPRNFQDTPPIDTDDVWNMAETGQTMKDFKEELILFLLQMMFVSGETGEPSAETTGIIEEIVRQQVVEIVSI